MQTITVICTPPNVVIRFGELRLTRAMSNAFAVTLADSAGSALDLSAVAAWELGITEDFLAATPLLAGTNAITAAENVLTIALNGHTVEMAGYLDGKKTARGFATLKGYDGAGDTVAAYVWPIVLQNVGFDANTEAAHAVDGLLYTAAQVDAKFAAIGDAIPAATESSRGTIALATAEEAAAGVEAGKAVTPATLKPLLDAIPDDLSDLADTTGILAGKVDKDGDKVLSDNNYTDADAAKVGKIELETLAELTGANVTIAPWTQSKWSASGTCSLTASGWAGSGHQVAYVLITLAAEATLAVSGATVADDDALSAAGTYACYLVNENGAVRFKVANFTEAAS